MSDSRPEDTRIEEILEAWYAASQAGEHLDLDELCSHDSGLRSRVERILEREAALVDAATVRGIRHGAPSRLERLGEFQILSQIGAGGMSHVFLARQESLGRDVALKVLKPHVSEEPAQRLRFRREAEITAALEDPHIVPVYETGEHEGFLYIAMKLLRGASLDQSSPLPPQEVAVIGSKIARALHAAHAVGIIHRDVKPANIFVEDGEPYLLDFGLARGRSHETVTREGQVPGTLLYMAPEQLRSGSEVLDPRIDVYGLGASLYQALSGRPPFDEERLEVLVRKMMTLDPPRLRLSGRHRDLEVILMRALDKDPTRRFASALDLAEELERYTAGHPIRSRPSGLFHRAVKLARRNRSVSITLGVAILAVLVLGGFLVDRVVRESTRWGQEIGRVEQELRQRQYYAAHRRGAELAQQRGGEARLDELRLLARGFLDRETLLDQLQANRRTQDLNQLRALACRVLDAPTAVREDSRTTVALAVVDYYSGEVAQAAERLRPVREAFPRTYAAVAALAASEDPAAAVRAASAGGEEWDPAEDHAFAALALRLAELPEAAMAEVDAALTIDDFHYRASYERAMLLLALSDSEASSEALRRCLRPGIPRPEVLINLARHHLRRGEVTLAAARLDQAEGCRQELELPRLFQLDLMRLELLFAEDPDSGFTQELAAARERWGDHPALDMLEGHAAERAGSRAAARAAFEASLARSHLPWQRRTAGIALLQSDIRTWAAAGDATESERQRLLGRASALEGDCRKAHERALLSDALLAQYQLLWDHQDPELRARCFAALLEALDTDAASPLARIECLRAVLSSLSTLGPQLSSGSALVVKALWEARQEARDVIGRARRHEFQLSPLLEEQTWICLSALALFLGDLPEAAEASHRARTLQDERAAPPEDPDARYLTWIERRVEGR